MNYVRLKRHQTTCKSCIKLQNGQVVTILFTCEFCKKELTSKHSLAYHINICKKKKELEKLHLDQKVKKDEIIGKNYLEKEIQLLKDEIIKIKQEKYYVKIEDKDIKQKDKDLKQKDKDLKQKNKEIEQKYKDVEQKDKDIEQKDKDIKQKDKEIKQKDKDIEQKDKDIEQKDKDIEQKDKDIEQKDKDIKQKDKEIEQKDKDIKQTDKDIKQTDKDIKQTPDYIELKNTKNNSTIEIYEYKFGPDFNVPIRSDGMINATALCKAGNKSIGHYLENKNTKEYIQELQTNIGIPILELITSNVGGNYSGTWVHRKIGYHLAQWISPLFAVKVSNILDELFITGKVETGNELHPIILNQKYTEQIKKLQTTIETQTEQNKTLQVDLETNKKNYHTLLCKHNSTLKTHRYTKFNYTDPCFYIIESGIKCKCKDNKNLYKFGITGIEHSSTIDDRLQSHRTLWPLLKVRFILLMKDVVLLEKNFKIMYEDEINPNGHEIIEGVELEFIVYRIKMLLRILSINDYKIIEREKLKEYNQYVDTTIKMDD